MLARVVLDGVATARDLAAELRVLRGLARDAEERGPRAVCVEDVEHAWRDIGIGTVIERERDLVARDGGARKAREVGAEPRAARPHSHGAQYDVVRRHRADRPRPRSEQ